MIRDDCFIIYLRKSEERKEDAEEQIDYKLMCFNGKVKCTFTCSERYSSEELKVTFFDNDWNMMPFWRHYPKSEKIINKPVNFEKMIELAEKISREMTFARVDFYEINRRIYFGEITLYPGCGFEEFHPVEWDYKLGDMMVLPSIRISEG